MESNRIIYGRVLNPPVNNSITFHRATNGPLNALTSVRNRFYLPPHSERCKQQSSVMARKVHVTVARLRNEAAIVPRSRDAEGWRGVPLWSSKPTNIFSLESLWRGYKDRGQRERCVRWETNSRNATTPFPLIFSTCMPAKMVYGHLNGDAWPVSFLFNGTSTLMKDPKKISKIREFIRAE